MYSWSKRRAHADRRTEHDRIETEGPTRLRGIAAAPNEVNEQLRHDRNVWRHRDLDVTSRERRQRPSRERVLIRVWPEHRRERGQRPCLIAPPLPRALAYNPAAYHDSHDDLLKIEAAQRFDFVYLPSVSRPTEEDQTNPWLGRGRASNLLRHVFDMPTQNGPPGTTIEPTLPGHLQREELQRRLAPSNTVLLTCGNPMSVAEISLVGRAQGIRVETEDW